MLLKSLLTILLTTLSLANDQLVGTDLSPTGPCASEITTLCPSLEFGHGRIAGCLRKAPSNSAEITPPCDIALEAFLLDAGDHVNTKSYKIRSSCQAEIVEGGVCGNTEGRETLKCLRGEVVGGKLGEACLAAVKERQVNSAKDLGMDPFLHEFCHMELSDTSDPVGAKCSVVPRSKQYSCLKSHRTELSEKCKSNLFSKEKAAAGDLRNDPEVARLCATEMATFCEGIAFGEGKMLPCLYKHRDAVRERSERHL